MQDFKDCSSAIRQTVSLLETSGINSFVLASILMAAAIEQYKNCFPDQTLTKSDIRELIERMEMV